MRWNQNFATWRGGKRSTVRALPALQGHRQVEDGEPWPVREGCGPQDAGQVLPPPLHPPHRATEQGSWDGEGWASQQERDRFPGPPRPGPARPPLGSPRRGQCPRPGVAPPLLPKSPPRRVLSALKVLEKHPDSPRGFQTSGSQTFRPETTSVGKRPRGLATPPCTQLIPRVPEHPSSEPL